MGFSALPQICWCEFPADLGSFAFHLLCVVGRALHLRANHKCLVAAGRLPFRCCRRCISKWSWSLMRAHVHNHFDYYFLESFFFSFRTIAVYCSLHQHVIATSADWWVDDCSQWTHTQTIIWWNCSFSPHICRISFLFIYIWRWANWYMLTARNMQKKKKTKERVGIGKHKQCWNTVESISPLAKKVKKRCKLNECEFPSGRPFSRQNENRRKNCAQK